MKPPTLVILNGRGEFFCGDWAEIRWTTEYANARLYFSGYVKREAGKLWVEVLDGDLPIRVIDGYGTSEEIELAFTHGNR